MLRYWGINLKGLFSYPPTVSPDEVLWLYEQLPDDSAVRRDPEGKGGQWELNTVLQAAIFNAVQANTHVFIAAHTPKGKQAPKPPKPILPPGIAKQPAGERVLRFEDL